MPLPEQIAELMKGRKSGRGQGNKPKGKGGGKGDYYAKLRAAKKAKAEEAAAKKVPDYRDRAKERRELKGEYETIAAEWENHGEVTVDQSKYLGGDFDHTHLVKGLDYALLTKVRTEMTKLSKADQLQQMRVKQKQQRKQRSFETELGRRVWNTVVETLHPHHSTFRQRLDRMGKAISMGQRIRGASTVFLPGRMCYEFEISASDNVRSDIPRIVYISKEDAPAFDNSKRVAGSLPETVERVRGAFQRAVEERKQRKREKALGGEASYTVAQKVVSRHKARDTETDIFQGAGGFSVSEVVKDARPAAERAQSSGGAGDAARKPSYFDDAGAEKYRKAPEGQLDLKEIEVDDGDADGADFEAAEQFSGARKGWVFKLGAQGLGYYQDAHSQQQANSEKEKRRERKRTSARAAARTAGAVEDGDDAYGECFPSAGLGHALMQTGGDSDDEEAAEAQKERIKRLGALGKKPNEATDPAAAEEKKKEAEARKRKRTENEEWQKIDSMIKKGNHSSLEELEAKMSKQRRNQAPVPREIMATPVYF